MRRVPGTAGALLAGVLAAGLALPACKSQVEKPLGESPLVADLVDYRNGLAMLQEGRADDAIELLMAARAANPTDPNVVNALGLAFLYKKDYPRAIKSFDAALDLQADFWEALNNRGVTYLSMGNLDLAEKDFNAVLDKAPNSGVKDARFNRGLLASKRERWADAERDFSLVVADDAFNTRAFKERGLVRLRLENFSGALEDFLRVLKDDPKDVVANYNAALCLIASSRRDLAVRYMERAAESAPESEEGKKAKRFLESEPSSSKGAR